ncbi:MAG TPA: FAD-dependent oxidoreductase [Gemmataceae bacterium]|nr:FAD-dependent oxidoreductase [Gemmataceae bacterium]
MKPRGVEQSHICDILIVGGGVIGTSIAFHLAQRRVGRVVLVEKAYLGAGASGKSAALIYQAHRHPLLTLLARRCLPVFEHFADLIGGPPVFWRTGMVRLTPRGDEAELDAWIARQQELGIDVRRISDQELMEVDPSSRVADDETAVFERAAGYVEAVQVVASLAEAARREGADLREGVEVRAILAEKGKVARVETNEGDYQCGRLVLATGAWTAQLPRTLRVEMPVQARRTQVALFRRPVAVGRRGAVFADFVQGLYLRPGQGDLLHAGDLALPPSDLPGDPDVYNEAVDSDWLPGIRQRMIRRCPPMYSCFGRGGYAYLIGQTPDELPILDRLPDLEGVYCAIAPGNESFLLAPLIGQVMTQWLIDITVADVDLTPFRLARFSEKETPEKGEEG